MNKLYIHIRFSVKAADISAYADLRVNYEIYNYLMEGFRIDLKKFLGLAMSNQCCPTVRM